MSAYGSYQSFSGSGYAAVQLHQTSRSLHLRKRHKNEDGWKYLGPEPETGIVAEKGWLKQTGHIQLKQKPFRAILQCGHVCRRLRKTRAMDQLNQILADATAAISAPIFICRSSAVHQYGESVFTATSYITKCGFAGLKAVHSF